MESNIPILSITILLPLISAFYIGFFIGRSNLDNKETHAIYVAILASSLTMISAISLMLGFDKNVSDFQFVEQYNWVDSIGLEFFVGVDGISIYFVLLTAFLSLLSIIASLFTVQKKIKEFLVCFLLLESFCIGAFCSLNLLLFYGFFEATLIPMCLIIGVWGDKNRVYASIKFFLYTFAGSVFLLLSLIYIYVKSGTFDITELPNYLKHLPLERQQLLWFGIFIATAVKIPMVPFHTWLPDAHVQAPTSGSVMLAGVLLKLGGYAMLRIIIPMFPNATESFSIYVLWLSGIAVIYASFVAFAQSDMKKMIAYSSIAHMGYVTGGIFSCSISGISGAVFQMISHGIISAALFLTIGILYERHKTKEISYYGGVSVSMPLLSFYFMIFTLGAIGLPGLSGFVGEFLSIVGIFSADIITGVVCSFGVILSALYMLVLYKRVFLGSASDAVLKFRDLCIVENLVLLPLAILVIYFGIKPNSILSIIDLSVVDLVSIYKS